MKRTFVVLAVLVFALGFAAGVVVAKGKGLASSVYEGKSPKEASVSILEVSQGMAGNGTWELIGIGRVYYLSGDKVSGQALFDRVLSGKAKKDDYLRVGRVYYEAGEWDKAASIFDKVLQMDPTDDDNHAEIGAYYNLHGDRARAEELFRKAFVKSESFWGTVNAAGSYVGVKPQ
jgi:tetratricopeptide (TPR) repeat protein